MKIVHLNTNPSGGAGIAAIRLHLAMLEQGLDSHIVFLRNKPLSLPNAYTYRENEHRIIFAIKDLLTRGINLLASRFNHYAPISLGFSLFNINKIPIVQQADIIQLHWVSKFFDFRFFKKSKQFVVWTLHDMAPFSAGNHYTFNYSHINSSLILKLNLAYKKYQIQNYNSLRVIAPSAWLSKMSKNSVLFNKYLHKHVRNTLDIYRFYPINDNKLRERYGYNSSDKIILYVAENILDERKGLSYFKDILPTLLLEENYQIILVGNGQLDIVHSNIQIVGSISDEATLLDYYRLADVFVITSLEDNFPNTILESMACGTPVVAFDNSGLGEFIEHKYTGYIAANMDKTELVKGIKYCLINHCFLANNSRKKVEQFCSPISIVKAHLKIYEDLLSE